MEQVAIITQQEADLLRGQEFAPASHYNPVQDCLANWIITIQEIEQTTNPEYLWVQDLPLIDWCGPYIPVSGDTENYFTQFFSGNTGQ
jgi:hypothetical protein